MAKTENRDESIRTVEMIAPTARIYPSVLGSKITIAPSVRVMDYVVIMAVGGMGDVTIEAGSYINPHCVLYGGNGIYIGHHTLIGPGTCIVPTNHAFDRQDANLKDQGFMASRGGVYIGDNVWIGANCTILDGAHIPSRSVIGAGSVVGCRIAAGVWVNKRELVRID